MTDPFPEPEPLDLTGLTATPLPLFDPFTVPNHRASDGASTEDAPKSTVRERLMGRTRTTTEKPRNVKTTKKVVPNVPGQFIEPLTDFYNGLAMAVMPFKPQVSMTLISPCREPRDESDVDIPTVAENCARAWDEAAQRSESVRRMLDGFNGVSVWGGLIAAHMPLVMALGFNPAGAMENMLKRQQREGDDD